MVGGCEPGACRIEQILFGVAKQAEMGAPGNSADKADPCIAQRVVGVRFRPAQRDGPARVRARRRSFRRCPGTVHVVALVGVSRRRGTLRRKVTPPAGLWRVRDSVASAGARAGRFSVLEEKVNRKIYFTCAAGCVPGSIRRPVRSPRRACRRRSSRARPRNRIPRSARPSRL